MEDFVRSEQTDRERLACLRSRLMLYSANDSLKKEEHLVPSPEEISKLKKEEEELLDRICGHEILLFTEFDSDSYKSCKVPIWICKCINPECQRIVRVHLLLGGSRTILKVNDPRLFKEEKLAGYERLFPENYVSFVKTHIISSDKPFDIPKESDIESNKLLDIYYEQLSNEFSSFSSQYSETGMTGEKFVKHLHMKFGTESKQA